MNENFSFTTGTYATAASKAALESLLNGDNFNAIEVSLPNNTKGKIPVTHVKKTSGFSECSVVKKSIEETDVTNNMEIIARVSFREDDQIVIDGGMGVGRITKPGLQLPIGEAAINPVPRKMILSATKGLTKRGVNIVISVPRGEEIAAGTTNARLGILGGISIIGTTGIMKRKSHSSFKQTILEQLKFCEKNNFKEVIITPGNISEQAMQDHFRERFQDHQIVQSGDYLGFALENAFKIKFSIILAGHPGKLAKVLSGHFQTHYTKSPAANEAVVDFLKDKLEDSIKRQGPQPNRASALVNKKTASKNKFLQCNSIAKELKESPTVEGMIEILQNHKKEKLLNDLAEQIAQKVQTFLKADSTIPILLFNMNKELVGKSEAGVEWING